MYSNLAFNKFLFFKNLINKFKKNQKKKPSLLFVSRLYFNQDRPQLVAAGNLLNKHNKCFHQTWLIQMKPSSCFKGNFRAPVTESGIHRREWLDTGSDGKRSGPSVLKWNYWFYGFFLPIQQKPSLFLLEKEGEKNFMDIYKKNSDFFLFHH